MGNCRNALWLGCFALLAGNAAQAADAPVDAPSVKICASWINRQGAHCLSDYQAHTLPGNTLYAISELPEGAKAGAFQHQWGGLPAEKVRSFERGRILVSEQKGGAGEGKTVSFSLVNADGEVVQKRSFDVRWKAGEMVAQEIEPDKPLVPEAISDPEKPVPSSTPTVTEPPRAASGGAVARWHTWRGELHGAYRWERTGKGSLTVIPYWNPEYRFASGNGIGARVGGTFWEDRRNESFPAFEGDVHASFPVAVGRHSLTLQPALGLHWWSARGLGVSGGALVDWALPRLPVSLVLGFRIWKQEDVGQRLVSLGVAREI